MREQVSPCLEEFLKVWDGRFLMQQTIYVSDDWYPIHLEPSRLKKVSITLKVYFISISHCMSACGC